MYDLIADMLQVLNDFVEQVFIFFFDILKQIFIDAPLQILSLLYDAILFALSQIPVPEFLQNAQGALNAIPPDVLYFMGILQIPFGLQAILAALFARFLIKMLPFVG